MIGAALRRALKYVGFLLGGLAGILLLWILVHLSTHGRTPPIRGEQGETLVNSIASLEWIELGGESQAVLLRGRDVHQPMVLMLHGGPGMPQMYLAHSFQHPLEQSFVMVQWDRLGAGKSFRPDLRPESLTLTRLMDDTIDLAQKLRERFHPPRLVLVGHSWGTFLGVRVVARRPDLFDLYIGVGQLAYFGAKNREVQRRFIREQASSHGDKDVLLALDRDGESLEPYLFRYGAEVHEERSFWPLLLRGLAAPEYTLADVGRLTKGLSLYGNSNLSDEQSNLIEVAPRLPIPIAFFTGRYDQTVPSELTSAYFDLLEAPSKHMVWFEHSAHFPFLEEPQAFAEALKREVAALPAH